MTYQEYLKKVNELIIEKDALYNRASKAIGQGDKIAARIFYVMIDDVQDELNSLKNPQDQLLTKDDLDFTS